MALTRFLRITKMFLLTKCTGHSFNISLNLTDMDTPLIGGGVKTFQQLTSRSCKANTRKMNGGS